MAELRTPVEVVACGDPRSEMLAMLRAVHARVKAGEVVGLMLIAEMPMGAYRASVCSTENVAERIGRLHLLAVDMAAVGREEIDDAD